jgi:DNA-binding CsgD family transcriptional regulator
VGNLAGMVSESSPPRTLVGRHSQLALLDGVLADLAAGRGRSVLVQGEPGIGKSALVAACLAGAGELGFEVLAGGCDGLGQRFPLSVLIETLGVRAHSADLLRARAAAALAEPAGGRPGRDLPVLAGDPVVAAIEQLLVLVDQLCAVRPVLLVVDDLQWADDASLLLWRRLSRATVQLPLVLIGLCRPVPRRVELEALRRDLSNAGGVLIPLGPLDRAEVSQLAEFLVGGRPGPRVALLLDSAAGNPLYVREIADALGRAGALAVADGVAELTGEPGPAGGDRGGRDPAQAPLTSLAGAIVDRLDYLSADCRRALLSAALMGADFAVADLARLVESSPGALVEVLEEAIAAGVLESAGVRLRFRHGLIRQALYEAMPPALRVALHRQAAQALIESGAPVERVAQVILSALDAVDGWELDWLGLNAAALAHRAPVIAAELFEHALAHAAHDDPHHAVLEDQFAAVAFLTARYDEAERTTRRILNTGGLAGPADPDRRSQAVWILGYTLLRTTRFDESVRVLGEVIGDERTAPVWRARLTALQSMALYRWEHDEEAQRAAAWALAEGERLADPAALAYALHASSLHSHADHDLAGYLALNDRALAVIGADPGLADLRLLLLNNRAVAMEASDRLEESADALAQARLLAERTGTSRLALIQITAGGQALNQGRWDDALAELDAIGDSAYEATMDVMVHAVAGLIAVHRDDGPAVARHLNALGGQIHAAGVGGGASVLLQLHSLAAERAGRPREAVEILRVLLDPEEERVREHRCDLLPSLVRLALAVGDRPTAQSACDAARQEADLEPLPFKRTAADWCRGLVDADPEALVTVAAYFRRTGWRYERATVLEEAAVLLAAAGDLGRARPALAEAMSIYEELDAVWDCRRAAGRLRPHGVRLGVRGPRQRPRTGWKSLTSTELRVAELVAQGRSNPDIAARLVLSRRTVQTHVSHILAKLEVHSRREIADLAEQAAS